MCIDRMASHWYIDATFNETSRDDVMSYHVVVFDDTTEKCTCRVDNVSTLHTHAAALCAYKTRAACAAPGWVHFDRGLYSHHRGASSHQHEDEQRS